MLRITIELVPHGFEDLKKTIGTVLIANDGTGDENTGNYRVVLSKDPRIAKKPGVWKRAHIYNFPRLELGCYDLLYRALRACVGNRNKEAKSS